jgi:hypothetical protein
MISPDLERLMTRKWYWIAGIALIAGGAGFAWLHFARAPFGSRFADETYNAATAADDADHPQRAQQLMMEACNEGSDRACAALRGNGSTGLEGAVAAVSSGAPSGAAALEDARVFCMANHAHIDAVSAEARKAGWTLKQGDERVMAQFVKSINGQTHSLYLWDAVQNGVHYSSCGARVAPGSADVIGIVRRFLGQDPAQVRDGFSEWVFVYRGGRRIFFPSGPAAEDAQKRGETVAFVSTGFHLGWSSVVYDEARHAAH